MIEVESIVAILVLFLVSFFLSLILNRFTIFVGKKIKILDIPDHRKIHTQSTPRWGGVALFLSTWLTGLLVLPGSKLFISLLLGSSILIIIGTLDDKWGVRASWKLFFHLLSSMIFVIITGSKFSFITLPLTGMIKFPASLGYILAIFWITLTINAFNLIDGLDGLACGLAIIALIGTAALSSNFTTFNLTIILTGSLLGFLFYNYPPAMEFLGDTGSMFIGFMIGSLTLVSGSKTYSFFSIFLPLSLILIPVLDTTWAFIRRIAKRTPPFQADKLHIHHRLLQLNLENREALVIILFISASIAIAGILLSFSRSLLSIFSLLILASSFILIVLIYSEYFRLGKLTSDIKHFFGVIAQKRKKLKKPAFLELVVNLLIAGYYLILLFRSVGITHMIMIVDMTFILIIGYVFYLKTKFQRNLGVVLFLSGILLVANLLIYLITLPSFDPFAAKKDVILIIILGYLFYEFFFLYYYNLLLPYPEDVLFAFLAAIISLSIKSFIPSWWSIIMVGGIMYLAVKLLLLKIEEW